MKLFIDTTKTNKTEIWIDSHQFEIKSDGRAAQLTLELIQDSLQKLNKDINEITQIEVATGPGSFTGIRVGVAVAQTLAMVLGVPLNNINVLEDVIKIKYENSKN